MQQKQTRQGFWERLTVFSTASGGYVINRGEKTTIQPNTVLEIEDYEFLFGLCLLFLVDFCEKCDRITTQFTKTHYFGERRHIFDE